MQDDWKVRPEDYYEILQVERNHPNLDRVLLDKYRILARQYHPDFIQDAPPDLQAEYQETFKQINRAYDNLKDAEKRARYNAWLDAGGLGEPLGRFSSAAGARSSRREQGGRERTTQEESRSSSPPPPPPPHLATDPAVLDFDTVPVGQPASITLHIRNAGGPCSGAELFRIRPPRHPSHPNYDPNHWLTISEPRPWPSLVQGDIAVQCEARPRGLAAGKTHGATVYLDYCGDTYTLPARITAPPSPYAKLKLPAIVAAGALVVLLLIALLHSGSSSTSANTHPAPVQPVAAANQPVNPAPVAPSPPPPPPPNPAATQLLVQVTTGGGPANGVPVHVWSATINPLGKPLQAGLQFGGGTDTSGTYAHHIDPGKYIIEVDVDGYGWGDFNDGTSSVSDKTYVDIAPGEQKQIPVALGTLNVSVFKPDGSAAAFNSPSVHLQKTDVAGHTIVDRDIGHVPATDATGFQQVVLAPGTYALQYLDKTMYNVVVNAGQTTSVNFVLPR